MPSESRVVVRAALTELLLSAIENPAEWTNLQIAENREPRRRPSWFRTRLVRNLLQTEPPDSPLCDYVLVSFLTGREPSLGAVEVPGTLTRRGISDFPARRLFQPELLDE